MNRLEGALMFLVLLAAVLWVAWRLEGLINRLTLVLRRAGRGHDEREKNRQAVA